jgi:hypothetical protein
MIEPMLPDPYDAVCGWCGRSVALKMVGPVHIIQTWDAGPRGERASLVSATYVCPRSQCNQPSLVFFNISHVEGRLYLRGVTSSLPAGTALDIEGLSEEIAADRREAWSSYYAGNRRAAIIMGRAAIQRAVRGLGAEGAGLKKEINDLVSRGILTNDLAKFAHEVRISGDDAAHPEELGEVGQAEAEESLAFLDDFLRVTVAMPELAERRRKERKLGEEPNA